MTEEVTGERGAGRAFVSDKGGVQMVDRAISLISGWYDTDPDYFTARDKATLDGLRLFSANLKNPWPSTYPDWRESMTEEQAVAGIKWATREITAMRAKVASLQAAQSASNSPTTNGEAARIPAAPDDVERLIRERRAIYETKRLQAYPSADDDCNLFDKMAHTVEAFDYLLDEIAALSAIPMPATGEVKRLRAALQTCVDAIQFYLMPSAMGGGIGEYAAVVNAEHARKAAIAALSDHTTKDDE